MSNTTDTEEIKRLIINASNAAQELMTYLDQNPNKINALKAELFARFDRNIKMRLIQLLF